ncbi:amino acid ABC transporter permease [Rhodobium gokarnense]|uniref:General L-amino acid transport system permease protein n=1 Tax=Rhodobium gokarnense TaxID=364296 RepID=A0ABT3HDM0_9HYPH|nr:ABC transporter permease subunit [Rhodobium gokarnense]MCW2308501.1 general L-amino acid transport system permease protein [Rhodobium gokarnense]
MKSPVVQSRSERRTAPAAPLWRSARVRGIAWQVLLLAAVIGTIAWMAVNAMRALDERGMTSGLDFLFSGTSFPLGEGFFSFTQGETYLRAFLVGIGNTVVLSFLGIVSATLLGGAIGIARLSQNGLISGVAGGYVLLFRNSPQLVQIVFWYTFFTLLPAPRGSWEIGLGIFASNRGLTLPAPERTDVFLWCLLAFAVGVLTSLVAGRIADHRRRRTGQRRRWAFWARVLPPFGFPLVLWGLFGAPATWSVPELAGFNFRGGVILSPEFLAIYFGLTFYIAAFIAEIVRGGLRSVEDGQMEASRAIGLGGADMYRKVIVPQALRAIIPPLSAQYVSLLKNSSLAVAVGYPDLFSVSNTLLTYSGRTIEVLSIMALVYLTISLFVGALSNLANHYVQIPER